MDSIWIIISVAIVIFAIWVGMIIQGSDWYKRKRGK